MSIRIQSEDFDLSTEVARLRAASPAVGAVVSFLGTVRDIHDNGSDTVFSMELEHYPGMTEKVLQTLETEVRARWQIEDMLIKSVKINKVEDSMDQGPQNDEK